MRSGRSLDPPAVALAVWCLAGAVAHGHHSVLAYDGSTPTTVTGRVIRVLWQNPHAYLLVDVPTTNGSVVRWTIENEGPVMLERLGWTKSTLKAGDIITSLGARARDGSPRLRCKSVELPDGRHLPCFAPGGA